MQECVGGTEWATRNVIDLTDLDTKAQKRAQARCSWLKSLDTGTLVTIKQEPNAQADSIKQDPADRPAAGELAEP